MSKCGIGLTTETGEQETVMQNIIMENRSEFDSLWISDEWKNV